MFLLKQLPAVEELVLLTVFVELGQPGAIALHSLEPFNVAVAVRLGPDPAQHPSSAV
jgi:hypothetical protein